MTTTTATGATPKFCSTSSTVVSVFFSSRSAVMRFCTMAGARPLLGSSISNRRRGSTIARAMASICFWPPESLPAG